MPKQTKLPEEVLAFFREHGRTGGVKRAEAMSSQERSEAARKAVQARWAKQKRTKKSEPKAR